MKTYTSTFAIIFLILGWSAAEELPREIEQLVSKRNHAVAKIDRTMIKELEKLKQRYIQGRNLKAANKTVELIELYSDKISSTPLGDPSPPSTKKLFSGMFRSENGTVFTMEFSGGTSRASVKQLESNGQNSEVATALLKDDKLEITYKRGGHKATMVHVDEDRFHWFWDGNFKKKPVMMTKHAATTDK